jgi:hypothetical protein
MSVRFGLRLRVATVPVIAGAALMLLLLGTSASHAGILTPQQIGFDAEDLERSLSGEQSGSSSVPYNAPTGPAGKDQDQRPSPMELLKDSLPGGQSSSSSSSSTGGAGGTGSVFALSNTIILVDDSFLRRLPEDHGLSLPDPPGTDLLRPPRSA